MYRCLNMLSPQAALFHVTCVYSPVHSECITSPFFCVMYLNSPCLPSFSFLTRPIYVSMICSYFHCYMVHRFLQLFLSGKAYTINYTPRDFFVCRHWRVSPTLWILFICTENPKLKCLWMLTIYFRENIKQLLNLAVKVYGLFHIS